MKNISGRGLAALDSGAAEKLDLGVLDHFVGYHLRRASAVFAADFNRVIGEFGMRQVPFAVLSMVARHAGINQGAIGQALGIKRANMVALVGDLIKQGLVERGEAPDDRRAFALSITAAGRQLVEECLRRLDAHEESLLADFDLDERRMLLALLARIEAKES